MALKLQVRTGIRLLALTLILFASTTDLSRAADTLTWQNEKGRVSADIQTTPLMHLLEAVSKQTGWHVYVESNTTFTVSTKFDNLPPGEALRHLLGDLNFALVPMTNESSRLYVFRSSQDNATQLVNPADLNPHKARAAKAVANELIVRLKPGASIDDIAKKLGAKVVGRIPGMNAYLLKFDDAAAASTARDALANNSDVQSVDSNFVVDAPPSAMPLGSAGVPPVQLTLNPPSGSGRPVVGLIDTAVQPLGNNLDSFLEKSLSVTDTASPDSSLPTHGTAMFENILRAASTVTGGSSSLQVVSVDVYGGSETTSTFDVAAGITAAVNNGANIINLSLGSPGNSQFLQDLIQQVVQKGIPVYAAAGNDASPELFYPAADPGVIAVTAAGGPGQIASYANYGSFVDLMAPGSSIIYFGNTAYLVSGTSSATSFISGLTAGIADSKNTTPSAAASAISSSPTFKFGPGK